MQTKVKRLFIATLVDNSLFEKKYPEIINEFSTFVIGKWVELNNLHFTYKFLGNVEVERIPEIQNALGNVLKKYESDLSIKGIGALPNLSKARVLYAGVFNAEKIIIRQQFYIENQMAKLGFEKEKRKYKPHVALVRIKKITSPKFKSFVEKMKEFNFGTMQSFSINLVESKLTNEGPIYTVIK